MAGKQTRIFAVFDMQKNDPRDFIGLTYMPKERILQAGLKTGEFEALDDVGYHFHSLSPPKVSLKKQFQESRLTRQLLDMIIKHK